MKTLKGLKSILALASLGVVAVLWHGAASAQTTANGPYYATPSWDQTLPAAMRFIVLSNMNSEAVLDRETGLVWEKSPSTSRFTWQDALKGCNTLSKGNRKGWRLPTIQELASLVDGDPANTSSPRLPLGHPFQNVQFSTLPFYWSATTYAFFANEAWIVAFNDGRVDIDETRATDFVWCVRGGQGVDPQ